MEKFSSRPYNEFNLNRYNNKTALMNAITNISYQKGGTNTGDAIKYMDNTMFKVGVYQQHHVEGGDISTIPCLRWGYIDNTMFKVGIYQQHHVKGGDISTTPC